MRTYSKLLSTSSKSTLNLRIQKIFVQDVNIAVPELKINKYAEDSDNELSDTKLEQIKMNKRKDANTKNGFYGPNLI